MSFLSEKSLGNRTLFWCFPDATLSAVKCLFPNLPSLEKFACRLAWRDQNVSSCKHFRIATVWNRFFLYHWFQNVNLRVRPTVLWTWTFHIEMPCWTTKSRVVEPATNRHRDIQGQVRITLTVSFAQLMESGKHEHKLPSGLCLAEISRLSDPALIRHGLVWPHQPVRSLCQGIHLFFSHSVDDRLTAQGAGWIPSVPVRLSGRVSSGKIRIGSLIQVGQTSPSTGQPLPGSWIGLNNWGGKRRVLMVVISLCVWAVTWKKETLFGKIWWCRCDDANGQCLGGRPPVSLCPLCAASVRWQIWVISPPFKPDLLPFIGAALTNAVVVGTLIHRMLLLGDNWLPSILSFD